MQNPAYTTIKRRFSRENLAAFHVLQNSSETFSDVAESAIRNYKTHIDNKFYLDFSELAAEELPERIVAQVNSSLEKTNAVTLRLSTFHVDFLQDEIEKYQHHNEMQRMPRWAWFLGRIVLASYFLKFEKKDFYKKISGSLETPSLSLCSELSEQMQPDILRSHVLRIRNECDEILKLLDS